MFTGLVKDIGMIRSIERRDGDARLNIEAPHLALSNFNLGDSVAVNGVCLTVVDLRPSEGLPYFNVDVSTETLTVTTLGLLEPGSAVNLEPALRMGDPLGGHLVSGHIDGVATITSIETDARSHRVAISHSADLSRFIAQKSSVAIDGVSLTVNEVLNGTFSVNLIPHTKAVTTLGNLRVGSRVNLEIDQIARYVARFLEVRT